jgi:hypothetical protein
MWNELFLNYTRIIPERRIFDLDERFPNHELVTMVWEGEKLRTGRE